MFKTVFCSQHHDYCRMEQQDAFDFLIYFLQELQKDEALLSSVTEMEAAPASSSSSSSSPSTPPVSISTLSLFSHVTCRAIECTACHDRRFKLNNDNIHITLELGLSNEDIEVAGW
jgi:uncharacterized UBP type Zn finger protein